MATLLKSFEIYVHIIDYGVTGVIHLLEPPVLAVFRYAKCKFSRAGTGLSAGNMAHPCDKNPRDHKIFVI